MNYKQTLFAIVVVLSLIMASLFYYSGTATLLAGRVTAMVNVNVAGVVMSNGIPINNSILTAGTTSTLLGLDTDILANCSYTTVSGTPYLLMTPFTNTNALFHSSTINVAGGTIYNYYIECNNSVTGVTPNTYQISFSVATQQVIYASRGEGGSDISIQYGDLTLYTNLGEVTSFSIKGETHKFVGNEIGANYVVLTFYSEPVTVKVFVDEAKSVDLDADAVDDLEIEVRSVNNGRADIVFKELEPVEKTALEKLAAIILDPLKRAAMYIYKEHIIILAIATGILVACTIWIVRSYVLKKKRRC